jgi:GlpG protein
LLLVVVVTGFALMTNQEPSAQEQQTIGSILQRMPVTVALIVVSITVAMVSNLGQDRMVLTWLTFSDLRQYDGSIASGFLALQQGQLWRIITPIFIHFGIFHILFNMMWLKDLGGLIEGQWSSRALIMLVLVSGITSNVAQFIFDWDFKEGVRTANALSGGMSGVVFALLGYAWMRGRFDSSSAIRLNQSVVIMMIAWLVICMTGLVGSIANTAHVVGLLVGMAWGIGASLAARKRMSVTTNQDW